VKEMGIFEKLKEEISKVERESKHLGYWYSISEVMLMMVCGMLCGLQRVDDIQDWVKAAPVQTFLESYFGIKRTPCRAQFYNILRCVDAEKFKLSFVRWMKSVLGETVAGKTVAIDGKTICGSDKLTKDGSILNVLSAYVGEFKMTIGSHECTSKPGERAAFRELLKLLDLKNTVVVADALHCTQKTVEAVIEAEADYLLVVKNNVPSLKSSIETHFQTETGSAFTTVEKNGGRIETRTAYACNEIEWLKDKNKWKNISTIGAIHRSFEKDGKTTSEWHYYISSAALTSSELLNHARLEWGVESMHWLLDVHFAEDKTRVWDMNVQKILNTTRKIALNMIRLFKNANYHQRIPLTSVLKENLFDTNKFSRFLDFFTTIDKLD
jgi:predicted transposase YbfD/YdcC